MHVGTKVSLGASNILHWHFRVPLAINLYTRAVQRQNKFKVIHAK